MAPAPAARGTRLAVGVYARPVLASALSVAGAMPFAGPLTAQQGTIAYTHSQEYDFEVPEGWGRLREMMPEADVRPMLLHFGPSASLMTPVHDEEEVGGGRGDRMPTRLWRMKMSSASRGDQEVIRDTYVSFDRDEVVETRDFMGRTFLIAGPRADYAWRLTGEQAEHLGRMVIKATAQQDSSSIEAWFTPEIPVPGGPASYGGLPGMILVLSVDGGRVQYFATEVTLGEVDAGLVRAPDDGDDVTREEYEGIVTEKLDELEKLNRRRGGDRD